MAVEIVKPKPYEVVCYFVAYGLATFFCQNRTLAGDDIVVFNQPFDLTSYAFSPRAASISDCVLIPPEIQLSMEK